MTEVSVIAERTGTVNNIPIQLGMNYFDAKFDTGSSVTVVSASVFYDGWKDEEIARLKEYCTNKGCQQREFKSASGHKISGYPVTVKDVCIGETIFPIFRYYLIIDGRREMSLIGDDFIDNCRYSHEPHGNINITAFDFDSYASDQINSLDSDDLLALIDEFIPY